LGEDGRGYVLEDASLVGTPEQWARQAIAVYDMLSADAIVAETNYGGEMVINTIRAIRPEVKVIEVRATRGKHVRAEPISALYSLGKVSHVGAFPELESQMCLMTAAGFEGEGSPDRVDALVWGFTELFPKLTPKAGSLTRSLPSKARAWRTASIGRTIGEDANARTGVLPETGLSVGAAQCALRRTRPEGLAQGRASQCALLGRREGRHRLQPHQRPAAARPAMTPLAHRIALRGVEGIAPASRTWLNSISR
jgi:hypothetical protein